MSRHRKKIQGTIYLIHLERPYRHARHYLGWTEGPLADRIAAHRSGQGSPLLRAATEVGINWYVVWTCVGDRYEERRLKNGKHVSRFCPACLDEEEDDEPVQLEPACALAC